MLKMTLEQFKSALPAAIESYQKQFGQLPDALICYSEDLYNELLHPLPINADDKPLTLDVVYSDAEEGYFALASYTTKLLIIGQAEVKPRQKIVISVDSLNIG